MTNKFNDFANKFGTSEKLLRGKPEYHARTIDEMRSSVIDRTQAALEIVKLKNEANAKNPMIRKIRNGLAIKIGYGVKNETLMVFGQDAQGNDVVERRFFEEDREDAIEYFEGALSLIEKGELDEELKAKLASFRSRAEKGKISRRKSKVIKTSGTGYISEVA